MRKGILAILFFIFAFSIASASSKQCCIPLPPGFQQVLPSVGSSTSSPGQNGQLRTTAVPSTHSLPKSKGKQSSGNSVHGSSNGNVLPLPEGSDKLLSGGGKGEGEEISESYKSIYDIVIRFLEAVFLMFLSVILLKPYVIIDKASSELREEFNREDARVISIRDGRQNAILREIRELDSRLASLQRVKEVSERIFTNIELTIDEVSQVLHRITEERTESNGEGWKLFESLRSKENTSKELERRLEELKEQLKSYISSLKELNRGSPLTVITNNEFEGLKNALNHIGSKGGSLSRITLTVDTLRSTISSRLDAEIKNVEEAKRRVEGSYFKVTPRVEFDLLAAMRAAEKRNLINSVEAVLSYCYSPFIKRFLEGRVLKTFIFLFFLFNFVSLIPFISGFVTQKGGSGVLIVLVVSLALAGLTLFLEYFFIPQMGFGILVQLLGLHKIPAPERLRQLNLFERMKVGWQLYLLKGLSFVALILLGFALYRYALIVYTLANLRVLSVF